MLDQNLKIDEHDRFSPAKSRFGQLTDSPISKGTNIITSTELARLIKEHTDKLARDLYEAKLNMIGSLEADSVEKEAMVLYALGRG